MVYKAMLKGSEFGRAIGEAIQRKLDSGSVASKAAIARHFGMKPPSLSDWVKKGSVAKEKLPELWRYFSDVVGPEHWGLSASEWPAGLSSAANDTTGGEPPMEARIARLEAHVEHIREDVSSIKVDIRILLGMIITGALGLAGLMAKGFGWF